MLNPKNQWPPKPSIHNLIQQPHPESHLQNPSPPPHLDVDRRRDDMGANDPMRRPLLETLDVVTGDDVRDQQLELQRHKPATGAI